MAKSKQNKKDRILRAILKKNTSLSIPDNFAEKLMRQIDLLVFKKSESHVSKSMWKFTFLVVTFLLGITSFALWSSPHFLHLRETVLFDLSFFSSSFPIEILLNIFGFILVFWGLFSLNKLLSTNR